MNVYKYKRVYRENKSLTMILPFIFSHAQVFFDFWNCYITSFQRDRRQREKGNKEYDQTVEIKRNNEL